MGLTRGSVCGGLSCLLIDVGGSSTVGTTPEASGPGYIGKLTKYKHVLSKGAS